MGVATITHTKVSSRSDSSDAGAVQPSDWNATHTIVHGPAFGANRATTDLTLTDATLTEVVFNSEDFDTGSAYNPANGRFTPQVAGYYQVNAKLVLTSTAADILNAQNLLYKNGASYRALNGYFVATGVQSTAVVAGGAIVPLNGSTDFISIYAYLDTTSGTPKVVIGSFFDAHFVRPL